MKRYILRVSKADIIQACVICIAAFFFCVGHIALSPEARKTIVQAFASRGSEPAMALLDFGSGPTEIPVKLALNAWSRREAFFVDARKPEEYAAAHVEGAYNLPFGDSDRYRKETIARLWKTDSLVVVYCEAAGCNKAYFVALELFEFGFNKVAVIPEGLEGWVKAGGPTAKNDK